MNKYGLNRQKPKILFGWFYVYPDKYYPDKPDTKLPTIFLVVIEN